MADKTRKVMIVDDEFRIGILIEKLIRWTELQMECVKVLDNGEAAFLAIREEQPDIVITDVRMPKVSGLDLIKMTRDSGIQVHFVVVSGYKEFEYAHRALTYGVEDYILKPVNGREINEVLWKIKQKLDDREQFFTMHEELKKTALESSKIIRRDFLKNIIDQADTETLPVGQVPMEGEAYRGVDIKLDHVDCNRRDDRQDRITTERVKDLIEPILRAELSEILICEKDSLHIYCLFNYNFEKSREVKKLLSTMLLKIKEYLMGFDQYEVTIGIGTEKKEFGEIRFSILEAYRAVCNRMRYGTGRLIYFDAVSGMEEQPEKNRFEEHKDEFLASIEACDRETLSNGITELFDNGRAAENRDMTCYYERAEKLIDLFYAQTNLSQEGEESQKKELLDKCQHCYKLPQLMRLLKQSLGDSLEMLRTLAETRSAKPIRQAKQYVEEHYREKILLEDIAAVVDLNPVYFSALFKKETDMNFSSYLISVRMEKAKKMLTSTNETIAAIGDAVGYGDQKYFSQLFKKVIGVKPAIYRRLHS